MLITCVIVVVCLIIALVAINAAPSPPVDPMMRWLLILLACGFAIAVIAARGGFAHVG